MKSKYLLILIALVLISCSKDIRYRWRVIGKITTIRIDDDSEYHFSTDKLLKNDVSQSKIIIVRKDTIPTLFCKQWRCGSGMCNAAPDDWEDVGFNEPMYKIVVPKDFKIETFDD